MTEDINKLNMIIAVLNNINTCGKKNLLNLGGAIEIIEEVVVSLNEMEANKTICDTDKE